jgi:hypothetical protein
MHNIRMILRHIFVWSYERGTIQYDIICILILAFIFFVPPGCFNAKRLNKAPSSRPEITTKIQTPQTNGN